ncbi:MAG: protein-glutamate O-methyltransferase CheR [Deltaproteobacteria bacterium]|nr:protein-glutamate O-methyltransferase CheR [Deltaproteobacteria bacterium]
MRSTRNDGPFVTLLAQWVEAHAGLHYEERDLDLFAERARLRASDAGFESLLDYYYALRYDDPDRRELEQLVEALVVSETYFFRELPPMSALIETLLPAIRRGERPRVWSAACATGEEPITLAILLEQRGLGDAIELVASDISERALERARRGEYGVRAHRALPPTGLPPWVEVRDGRARVEDSLRTRIEWRRVNLLDADEVAALGTFDAILCRNVLIYFSDQTVRSVVGHLASALRPGGRLLVGISESLLRFGTALRCEERAGAFFYRCGQ